MARHSRGGAAPEQVRTVRARFESWRKSKHGRERIPDRLWRAAAKLCERHGVNRVSGWLRLNYTSLRDHVGTTSARRIRRRDPAPKFVEWVSTTPASASPAEYVVEMDDARGPNVRVRVRGAAVADVAALARLLRKEEA